MPKHKRYDFRHLQGASSTKQQTSNDAAKTPPLSVNERLSELRLADPATASAKKRELAEWLNQHSLPEQLQGLLGAPRTAPPRSRFLTRTRPRGTPGPVPPSWLRGDTGGTRTTTTTTTHSKHAQHGNTSRPRLHELFRFDKLCGLTNSQDGASSLVHCCLEQIAASWGSIDADEQQAVLGLPSKLRLRLISYIGYHGHNISFDMFTALTQDNDTMDALDLAGLMGHDTLTVARLAKLFRDCKKISREEKEVDSWDAEVLSPSLSVTNFTSITHLCLSHPAATVSWSDLLSLTKHTRALTHLSLAYWPRPTLTPNLATTVVASHHGPDVTAGASHFYSEMDEDQAEPRAVLRQLSHNLLRLTWLDIEGNPAWLIAMTTSPATAIPTSNFLTDRPVRAASTMNEAPGVMVELTTTWANLSYIRCAESYMPHATWKAVAASQNNWRFGVANMTDDPRVLADHLRPLPIDADEHGPVRTTGRVQRDADSRFVEDARAINDYRRRAACPPIVFDFGW